MLTDSGIRLQGLLLAITAEMEGMSLANHQAERQAEPLPYQPHNFAELANRIENLVYEHKQGML